MQVPFTVWVLKNFSTRVPRSIFEAARLDGASRARTLWTIVLPLVAPGLGATAIFNLAAYWSEFSLALVLLDSQARYTMPLGLFSFQSAYETEWQLLAAASFIALVPGDRRIRVPAAILRRRPHRRRRQKDDTHVGSDSSTSTSFRTPTGIASGI